MEPSDCEMGYKGPITAPAALETQTVLEVADECADDVILPVTNDIPQTEIQKVVQGRFTKLFGKVALKSKKAKGN